MPYRSERQRRYLHARHPDIAARWDREYGPEPKARVKVRRRPAKRGGR